MAKFQYKAIKDGKTITGTAESASREILISTLTKQGIRPVLVKLDSGKAGGLSLFSSKPKVKLADLVVFTRQLSVMIAAGVPLARSLAALQADSESQALRQVLTGVSKDVESGIPLGDAFAKYPSVFSEVYVNMVRAGEDGGILDEILKRLATQVEQENSIRKKVKSAMMYPMVIMTVTVLGFFVIMLVIVPKINKILLDLGGPDAQLPVYTRALLSASDFFRHNIFFIMIVVVVGTVVFLRYIKTPAGKYRFHYVLLKVPILKTIISKIAIARFARTFASLMSAGVTVLDALEVTGGAIGNKVIEKDLKNAAEEVKNGKPLSEPIGQSPNFPPIVAQMLSVGEETGQIDVVLVKVADFYEEEAATMIDGLSAIIEPVMIVFLGGAVGILAASVMGPIANLTKNVGNG